MNKIRTLIADDHIIVRAGIRQFLNSAPDIEVLAEAEYGEQAKALIQAERPDVAVLDIQMPKATGIEVTRWAKANTREVGILILTAYNDDPYVMAVLQAGANGFVLKTADPDEIVQAVRNVHAGKSVLDPAVTGALMAQMFSKQEAQLVKDLTDREMEVLQLAARGYTNKAIGVQLRISDRTVQGHLAHIFDKLQASSRTEAVMRAVSLGWISQDVGTISEEWCMEAKDKRQQRSSLLWKGSTLQLLGVIIFSLAILVLLFSLGGAFAHQQAMRRMIGERDTSR